MTEELKDRRIIITGAANGIGRATVERFLTEGASVGAIDRDGTRLEQLKRDLSNSRLSTFAADVTDEASVGTAVAAAGGALGGIDGVVNSAGIDLVADIESMRTIDWNRVLAVNLTGPMLVMRAAYPHLKTAGGGTIVNVSSGAGLSPLQNRMAYCASKAGLQMASKALAIEAATHGIRVNTVCPGAVETALFRESIEPSPDPHATYEAVKARYALRRVAEPKEIAAAILWLTSSESAYVTGTAMAVDGGRTFH